MRRFHRWFGLVTGIFMALIAATGVTMQAVDLVSPEHHGPPPFARVGEAPPGAVAPGRPDGPPGDEHDPGFRGLIDHIHDGEFLGNTGRVVSLLLGLALFFFSVSGIWMYWKMFAVRQRSGSNRLFW